MQSNIWKVMERVILDDNVRSFAQVDPLYKTELTVMCMQRDGIDAIDFCTMVDPEALTNKLIKYMLTNDVCRAMDLASSLEKMAVQWYESELEGIFDTCLEQLAIDEKKDAGLKSYVNQNNGEVIWG